MGLVEKVARLVGGDWAFFTEAGVPVVPNEILGAGDSTLDQELLRAEVRHLMKRAVAGELIPYKDVDVIPRRRHMFELRWEIGGDPHVRTRLWRLYFVCQLDDHPTRWALRFAEKRRRGPRDLWQQDRDIDLAWKRYRAWSARRGTS